MRLAMACRAAWIYHVAAVANVTSTTLAAPSALLYASYRSSRGLEPLRANTA